MRASVDKSTIGMRLVAAGLLITSGFLVYGRGGLLAWSGLIVAILLLVKHCVRPARTDVFVVLGFTVVWAACWAAAWGYVRSTWESGEVVELSVPVSDAVHTARVWVLDVDGEPVIYYDAPPKIGRALLASPPVTIERGDETVAGCADATLVEDVPAEELAALLGLMETKYRERNRATDVFYAVLGVERDRVGLVVRLKACS